MGQPWLARTRPIVKIQKYIPPPASGDDVLEDLAADLREPLLAAQVQIAELILVEAKLVEKSRVKVAEMDRILDGLESQRIGCAVADPGPEASAGGVHAEP